MSSNATTILARPEGRKAVEKSVPNELWLKNGGFLLQVKPQIMEHRVCSHPLLAKFKEEKQDREFIKRLHLESYHAFVQIFTDSLLRGMVACEQLVPRLGHEGKIAARFLLQINILDELGFSPSASAGEYAGTPQNAHFIKFQETLSQLGISKEEIEAYKPSKEAMDVKRTFEETYDDYLMLACILALSEEIFPDFANIWSEITGKSSGIDVGQGYHAVHIDSGEGSIEEGHSEDSWYLVRQALFPERYEELKDKMLEWLDVWAKFADYIMKASTSNG